MDARLAAVIVHDIKNALGVLEGELHTLTTEPTSSKALHAHHTCSALREKLIGFLTLYKASSQGLHPNIDAVNPEDFLRGLLKTRVSARPDLRINIQTSKMPVLAFFDENLVGLALEAALQNAERFARAVVSISCRTCEDGHVSFLIHDDGDGLGTKEETPSTGLGMELCRAIAHAHAKGERRGSVALTDAGDGGALFQMFLPQ